MIYAVTCLEANFLTWWTATSLPSAIFILSCVTQATLETRVCHSRAYFNSHPTPLLSFYLLLPAPSLHFHSRTLPHVDAIAPSYQNVLKRSGTRSVPLFFLCHSFGSMVHRDLPCVLVRWSRLYSSSLHDLHDHAFLSLRYFQFPFAAMIISFFHIFFLPVAHWCALCATYPSWIVNFWPWDCSKYPLSSSADPSFSVRAEFFSPRKFSIAHVP